MTKKNSTQTKTDNKEDHDDILPDADDDIEASAAPQTEVDQDEPAVVEEEDKPKLSRFEDARARAVERYRAQRDAEASETSNNSDDNDEGESETGDVNGDNDEKVETGAENEVKEPEKDVAADSDPTPQPLKHKVKIDGVEQELSTDDLIAIAQKHGAADNRLEEAKRLLTEAKQVVRPSDPENQPEDREQDTQPPTRSGAHQDPENQRNLGVDPDKLKGIVERIQVGDTDEGLEAVTELISLVKADRPDLDAEAVGGIVQQHILDQRYQEENTAALRNFKDKYPVIAADPDLAKVGMEMLGRQLAQDLASVGMADADIAPIKGNVQALVQAHQKVRQAGHKVRTPSELFDAVGQTMSSKFVFANPQANPSQPETKKPAPTSSTAQDRQERKRTMPTQPRATGIREQKPQAPKPKTPQAIVREARKQRGFAVLD
jgi:hypothetical protein